ncbi:hypothetical protein RUND412_006068, partial [Rhizina undulata]
MKSFTIIALLSTAATLIGASATPTSAEIPTVVERALPSLTSLADYQQPVVLDNVHAGAPDTAFPSEGGELAEGFHTYQAFDMTPEDFSGYMCRFHFIMGVGDGGDGFGEIFAITGEVN